MSQKKPAIKNMSPLNRRAHKIIRTFHYPSWESLILTASFFQYFNVQKWNIIEEL